MSAEQDIQVLNEALSIVLAENDAYYTELAEAAGDDAWANLMAAVNPEAPTMPEPLTPEPADDWQQDGTRSADMLGRILTGGLIVCAVLAGAAAVASWVGWL